MNIEEPPFINEVGSRLSSYCVVLFLIWFIASCGIAKQPTSPLTKTFETSAEYLKEGKLHFDSGQFVEAQRYLLDAIRLDPNNQPARILAGVTWAKLGKASNARQEFEKAIVIDKDTADGITARTWLKRLENPLQIALFPFENRSQNQGYGIDRSSYQAIYRQLFESGLYSMLDERQLGYWGAHQGTGQSQVCQRAREKGAKIALLGVISDFAFVQDKPPLIDLRGQAATYYAAALKVTLQIYVTSDCRLIDTFSKSSSRRHIRDTGREAALNQIVASVSQQLALSVHAALV